MMDQIGPNHPAWQLTFPHRVVPLQDEWLPGLLLRCDEVNHWQSETTLSQILLPSQKISWKQLLSNMNHLVVPSLLRLDSLAQFLAVPLHWIIATTYQQELTRLFNLVPPVPKKLGLSSSFRLCPECVSQRRLLKRIVVLPHISCCHEHQVLLQDTCQCQMALHLYHHQSQPFTCYKCGLPWAELPRNPADPSRLALEQNYLSLYSFFFTKGTPALLASARQLLLDDLEEQGERAITDSELEKVSSLSTLIYLLVNRGYSPRDILVYAGPLPWRSLKWLAFTCPVQTCPSMIPDKDRL